MISLYIVTNIFLSVKCLTEGSNFSHKTRKYEIPKSRKIRAFFTHAHAHRAFNKLKPTRFASPRALPAKSRLPFAIAAAKFSTHVRRISLTSTFSRIFRVRAFYFWGKVISVRLIRWRARVHNDIDNDWWSVKEIVSLMKRISTGRVVHSKKKEWAP